MKPDFKKNNGLVPVVTVDANGGRVLMQAYMNEEAYEKTLSTGYAHYFSRSRNSLWKKGETSGCVQRVVSVSLDCDCDCVLLRVFQTGTACHTKKRSCFFNTVKEFSKVAESDVFFDDLRTIAERIENPVEGSYTNYLWDKGLDKICKKVGEEASEVIIAAKNNDKLELTNELADLVFHLQILSLKCGITPNDVLSVMEQRSLEKRKKDY